MLQKAIVIGDRLERCLIGVFLAIATVICFLEVIARYFFHFSFYWAEEFILYFIIWSTFLGSSQVLKQGGHIRLNILVSRVTPRVQRYLDLVTSIIGLTFCLFLLVSGFRLIAGAYTGGVTSSSLAKISLWMPYSIMPIAGILLSFRFAERFLFILAQKKGE